jgi:dipeptidase
MELVRLGLERSRSAAEAVEVMTALISDYGQGQFNNEAGVRTYDNGFLVADPHEAYVIETAGHEWAVVRVDGTMGISNVYSVEEDWTRVSPGARQEAVEQGWWSSGDEGFNFADAYTADRRDTGSGAMRRARSCTLLDRHAGAIDVRTIISLLSDHAGEGESGIPLQTDLVAGPGICRHPNDDGTGGCTAAGLVADLCDDGSRLPVYWCCFYSPCLSLFLPIFIEGDLPPSLSIGGATATDDSPWWLFYRLNLAVLQEPAARAPIVRERWAPLQRQLLTTAYDVAGQGRRLIDDGQDAEAQRLLTGYMAANTESMLRTMVQLLAEFDADVRSAPVQMQDVAG